VRTTIQLSLDAEDPQRLIGFWCEVLGYEREPLGDSTRAELEAMGLDPASSGRWFAAAVDPDGRGPRLLAQRVPEPKSAKNRLHLDLHVDSTAALEDEVDRLVGLGASRQAGHDEHGTRWTVLADPEGNEFCVGAPSGR
jgi:catechol 2,3-dioxygenase-like lactoylglutathione lyase family enzyme